jgi:phosphoacetylglucosamine mutase
MVAVQTIHTDPVEGTQDNGVKLVDPRGEMLETSWEAHVTAVSNAPTSEALVQALETLAASLKIDLSKPSLVVYGHDTRPSCPALVGALEDGLKALGAQTVEAGLKTTPQLHYLVRAINTQGTRDSFGVPTEKGYYEKLAKAFKTLVVRTHPPRWQTVFSSRRPTETPPLAQNGKTPLSTPVTVDAANGVGGPKLRLLLETIGKGSPLSVEIIRDDIKTPGALNNSCGADYVKTSQKAPPGLQLVAGNRYCSLDGDADRIVYYYQDTEGTFRLLDGDKIATLAAMYVIELVKQAGIELEVGVVQTAYANGSSSAYITKVLVRVLALWIPFHIFLCDLCFLPRVGTGHPSDSDGDRCQASPSRSRKVRDWRLL